MNKYKKKIGITTCWGTENNYGQVLQLYALMEYLKSLGFKDVELIRFNYNYINTQVRLKKILYLIKNKQFLKRIIRKILSKRKCDKSGFVQNINLNRKRNRFFYDFIKRNIQVSNQKYTNFDILKNNSNIYDILITGSDQVWSSSSFPLIPYFTLVFGSEKTLKIAYAAGTARGVPFSKNTLKMYLKGIIKLDAISVREKVVMEQLNTIKGLNTCTVPDPTILIAKKYFDCFLKPVKKLDVFYYGLSAHSCIEYQDMVCFLSNKDKLETNFTLGNNAFDYNDICPTIEEWISYIATAKLVVTNSFHGVVFCLRYQTPFYYIPLLPKEGQEDIRVPNLLDFVNIKNREIKSIEELEEKLKLPTDDINWFLVEQRLQNFSLVGQNFLKSSLGVE